MAYADEYRCFIGGLSWSTTDDGLKDAFGKFGRLTETKVVVDKFTGKSKGFGFVTFEAKQAMEDAIEEMHGISIDGRSITVDKAQPQNSSRDRDGGRDYDRDRERGGRGSGGGWGSGGGECFKCGKPGHFARECHSDDGSRGGRYGGRDDRYGGGGGRYDSDRSRDRNGGRSRDSGSGSDRYNRDRSSPYDRRSSGSRRD